MVYYLHKVEHEECIARHPERVRIVIMSPTVIICSCWSWAIYQFVALYGLVIFSSERNLMKKITKPCVYSTAFQQHLNSPSVRLERFIWGRWEASLQISIRRYCVLSGYSSRHPSLKQFSNEGNRYPLFECTSQIHVGSTEVTDYFMGLRRTLWRNLGSHDNWLEFKYSSLLFSSMGALSWYVGGEVN